MRYNIILAMQLNSKYNSLKNQPFLSLAQVSMPIISPKGILSQKSEKQSHLFQKNKLKLQQTEVQAEFGSKSTHTLRGDCVESTFQGQERGVTSPIKGSWKEKIEGFKKKLQYNQQLVSKIKNSVLVNKNSTPKGNFFKVKATVSEQPARTPPTVALVTDQQVQLIKTEFSAKRSERDTQASQTHSCQKTAQQEMLVLTINNRKEVFWIIKFLDEGTYGKVYLARHLFTGFIACIKAIDKTDISEDYLQRLAQEIKIQSSMNHPNIINLYGYTADAEKIYLILEPCLGSNAYQRLSQAPIPEKQASRYTKEICSAIQHLHRRDVIHRDIKAQNIIFHEGVAKLCDFGWAVYAPLLRSTKCGTPLYSPPEIVMSEPYDSKVDIWCLGVLLYEMLYATSPFEIRNRSDLSKIVEEPIFFSKEAPISELAKDFMAHCLEKKPIRRPNIRQVLEHEFLACKSVQYRHTMA